MRSPSRGHVRIKSRDPHQHPGILFNYMSHEQDWQEFRDAIRITRGSCINPRWINTVAAKSATVSDARRMSSSMSSCVTTPKPRFIRAVPAKWVMTRWLWLTARPRTQAGRPARGGCVNYAANYHRQFERHDDYDWRENSGYDSWEGSVAEEHGGIFCGKWDESEKK